MPRPTPAGIQSPAGVFSFALVGVTDALDGFLARRWHASSRLGAYLDPIADKVLLSGTLLVLAFTGAIETWLVVVVLGRDLLIVDKLRRSAGRFLDWMIRARGPVEQWQEALAACLPEDPLAKLDSIRARIG